MIENSSKVNICIGLVLVKGLSGFTPARVGTQMSSIICTSQVFLARSDHMMTTLDSSVKMRVHSKTITVHSLKIDVFNQKLGSLRNQCNQER